ncbi:hypothetical protein [Algibacter sp. Ld11]|uniref:hypothetical protein n=1 Tax=Algibacter sp. Ld11 TaxID=649150 RepID=UPI003864AE51
MNILLTSTAIAQNTTELVNSLNSLISILSIAFITILVLLTLNIYKVYKLKKRNSLLESELRTLRTETKQS